MLSWVVVASGGLLASTPRPARADQCLDVLAWAAQDTLRSNRAMSNAETARHVLCAKNGQERSGNSSFAFNIPVPQLKGILGLGTSEQNASHRRSEFCDHKDRQLQSSHVEEVLQVTGNPKAIDAWKECNALRDKGLSCEVQQSGPPRTYLVTATWAPRYTAPDAKIQGSPILAGVTCTDPPTGELQDKVGRSFSCVKSVAEPASVTLNTSQGRVTCNFPKDPPTPTPGREAIECAQGLEVACQALESKAYDDFLACKRREESRPPPATAKEHQEAAEGARACGNLWANYQAFLALVQNERHQCSTHGAKSTPCLEAMDSVDRNLTPMVGERRAP